MAPYSGYSGLGVSTLSPGIQQRGQATIDDLTAPVADEDALDLAETIALGFAVDGFDRGLDAQRLRVAVMAIHHRLQHRLDHVRRCGEVKFAGIADVEIEDPVTFARDLVGDHGQIANGVPHIGHAACGQNSGDFLSSHDWFLSLKCRLYSGRSICARCSVSE